MNENQTIPKSIANAEQALGKNLLVSLVEEIRALRTHWSITPKQQQDEIIERLEERIGEAVINAVAIIAKGQHTIVQAHVESVTFKDGVKAVLTTTKSGDSVHKLADAEGSNVIILITDAEKYLEGMKQVRGEDDQRQLPGLAA